MHKTLSGVGSLLCGMRFTMLFFYVGLVAIIIGILGKFLVEAYKRSGVHALKTWLSGDLSLENVQVLALVAVIHFTFVLSAMGLSFAGRMTRDKH